MTRIAEPCLTTVHIRELIPRLPENVYVQRVTIEACRLSRHDIKRPETQYFEVKQAYPNLFIPTQTLIFSTPLMNDGAKFDISNDWESFVMELDEADGLCMNYDFRGVPDLVDIPFSDRLFIKDIILLELPIDDPNYHPSPYYPADSDDRFYDGVRCSFATFTGSYQLLGRGTQEERDGWLPGHTRKAMDLEHIEVVRSKHIRQLRGRGGLMAFHRGRNDIHIEEKADLVNHPDRTSTWLPTLVNNGLIVQRAIEGEWEATKKFRADSVSLHRMIREREEVGARIIEEEEKDENV